MQVELLPGTRTVVRLPVELREPPTLELLYELAPDVRRVPDIVEAFDLEMPAFDLRDQVDADTTAYIASQVPRHGAERDAMLDELLDPVVRAAISACRASREAWDEVAVIEDRLERARRAGDDFRAGWLQEQVETLAFHAAELMLTAHVRAQEAGGVARAVRLPGRGLIAFYFDADTWLFEGFGWLGRLFGRLATFVLRVREEANW
jgi:hypothetical protein